MSEALASFALRLSEARQRGNPDEIAEALAGHANALLQTGQTGAAQQQLDEAAAIHRSRNRTIDEARCLQMAGTLCRFQGRLDEAKGRVDRALQLAPNGPIAVSSHTELGEIALAGGHASEAAAEYRAALEAGENTGLIASARAALLRRRATALAAAGAYPDAIQDLDAAYELLMQTGDRTAATRMLIEEASALQQSRRFDDAPPIIERAMQMAGPAGDHGAMADIHILRATQALERRDPQAAMVAALAARTEALAANAPTPYIGAAHTIAHLAESAGDRLAAYEALAVGWVTLADLLQPTVARAAFEPKLREMRERWGATVFEEVKKTYEANRRKALGS